MLELNTPFSVDGYVIDSHLVHPHQSFTEQDNYRVTLMLSDCGLIEDIINVFKQHESPDKPLEIVGVDADAYTITAQTLNAPRLPGKREEEYQAGDELSLRIKCDIFQGEVSDTGRLLLLTASEFDEEELQELTWTKDFQEYHF